LGFRVWGVGLKFESLGVGGWGLGVGFLGFRVYAVRCYGYGLGYGVRGFGFGVWGLRVSGLGIHGLGLRIGVADDSHKRRLPRPPTPHILNPKP